MRRVQFAGHKLGFEMGWLGSSFQASKPAARKLGGALGWWGDHSLGPSLTHPPWPCPSWKTKNHRPTVGQVCWATCQGGGGRGAWERRAHVRQRPGRRSLPRRRVTEKAAGECCCGVRSLGSDQPVVSTLPHPGAKMTAQSEGGGAECGEEAQAWETKPASSPSPLMGSQGRRGGWRRAPSHRNRTAFG